MSYILNKESTPGSWNAIVGLGKVSTLLQVCAYGRKALDTFSRSLCNRRQGRTSYVRDCEGLQRDFAEFCNLYQ